MEQWNGSFFNLPCNIFTVSPFARRIRSMRVQTVITTAVGALEWRRSCIRASPQAYLREYGNAAYLFHVYLRMLSHAREAEPCTAGSEAWRVRAPQSTNE